MENRSKFTEIPDFQAKSVACGRHTIMIDQEDSVWSCGNNQFGQLGLGNNNNKLVLTEIPGFKATSVACARNYTVLIRK